MSIKIKYKLEKGLYVAYTERKDKPAIILAIGETFAETIAKAWHRTIVKQNYGKRIHVN